MFVNAHFDVEFFHQLLDGIEAVHGFGGNGRQIQLASELESFSRPGFVPGDANHAVIHSLYLVLDEFVFDLLNDFVGKIMAEFYGWFGLAQFLAWEKLDGFSAGLGGFLDGLENGEVIEGPSLTSNDEAANFILVRIGWCAVDWMNGTDHHSGYRDDGEGP